MVEIVDLLFYQILKLNPSQVSGNFQSDFVYLLLIPTIIIILILQGLPKIFGVTSKGLRTLISIGGLAIIIERGWYGTLASLGTTFFIIGLILAIISTFWFKIFKKEHAAGALKGGDWIRKQTGLRPFSSYLPASKDEAKKKLASLSGQYNYLMKELETARREKDPKATERVSEIIAECTEILNAYNNDEELVKSISGKLKEELKEMNVIK